MQVVGGAAGGRDGQDAGAPWGVDGLDLADTSVRHITSRARVAWLSVHSRQSVGHLVGDGDVPGGRPERGRWRARLDTERPGAVSLVARRSIGVGRPRGQRVDLGLGSGSVGAELA
jgi:hypothetical protein